MKYIFAMEAYMPNNTFIESVSLDFFSKKTTKINVYNYITIKMKI